MIKTILAFGGIFIAGILFSYIRGKIFKKVADTAKENFNLKKFRAGLFRLGDKVSWAKDIAQLFNIRRLVIYALIAGSIYGYAYWKGQGGKPVYVDISRGKEVQIKLNGDSLHIHKDGTIHVHDKNDKIIKQITVKDIPSLNRKLKPIGLQFEPIVVVGGGTGLSGSGIEAGGGVSFLRYWKWRLDSFLTQRGIYVGTSYKITENSRIGLAGGKGYKGDSRAMIYYGVRF